MSLPIRQRQLEKITALITTYGPIPKVISGCEYHDSKILEQMDLSGKLLKEPVETFI